MILLGGLIAGIQVFWKGLGITNLTDLVPWGLWITIDLSSIALGAGAFSLCAGVYLFGLKRYQPIARTATFVGLIGYTMATLALILDIGKPERFWHSMVYWNTHSLLWEVTMCITLYFSVLLLEVFPTVMELPVLERFKRLRGIAQLGLVQLGLVRASGRGPGLFDPKLGKIDIPPSGEAIFQVPGGLAVADEH